jgi:polysaccharide biosynthesis transport protein
MSITLVLQVLRRRGWIVGQAFFATVVGAVLLLILFPPRYDAVATASMDPSASDPVSGTTTSPNATLIIQGNLIALAKSSQVAQAVVKRLNMEADAASQDAYRASSASGIIDIRQWLASGLLDRVDAKFAVSSNVLSITYKGSSPQEAATLANAFASAFIDAAIAQKGAAAQKAAEWFAPQVEKARDDLAAAREKLTRFQTDTGLLAPSAADAENDQLLSATNDLSRAKADLVAMQSQYAAPTPTAASSNEAQSVDIQTLINLRANIASLDTDIAKMQTEVGANNPKLFEKIAQRKSLDRQIEKQFDDYKGKLADRIAAQKDKIVSLEKARADRMTNMIAIQGQREKLAAMTRDVQFYQEELDRVQKAATQARLQSQLSFSNIVLIDAAAPPTSVAFPKPIIVLPLSAFVGLALGVLLALLAEALHRRIRNGEDLQFVTAAPLLGVMVDIHPKPPSLVGRLVSRLRFVARDTYLLARQRRTPASATRGE